MDNIFIFIFFSTITLFFHKYYPCHIAKSISPGILSTYAISQLPYIIKNMFEIHTNYSKLIIAFIASSVIDLFFIKRKSLIIHHIFYIFCGIFILCYPFPRNLAIICISSDILPVLTTFYYVNKNKTVKTTLTYIRLGIFMLYRIPLSCFVLYHNYLILDNYIIYIGVTYTILQDLFWIKKLLKLLTR